MDKNTWAKKINELKRNLNLDTGGLAKLVGCSHAAVWHWERGNHCPGGAYKETLERMIKAIPPKLPQLPFLTPTPAPAKPTETGEELVLFTTGSMERLGIKSTHAAGEVGVFLEKEGVKVQGYAQVGKRKQNFIRKADMDLLTERYAPKPEPEPEQTPAPRKDKDVDLPEIIKWMEERFLNIGKGLLHLEGRLDGLYSKLSSFGALFTRMSRQDGALAKLIKRTGYTRQEVQQILAVAESLHQELTGRPFPEEEEKEEAPAEDTPPPAVPTEEGVH